ncbi:hypothetical protein GCM10023194_21210 [Planotetraspora phitsanulokensis]|uniref:Uncharacterized protein n=1 Tax=Planotetraspora phitsanulokensis TaxID=575192 RepID=A0A8J3XEU5_9ACTN|nr:hypothetical protein Pph01_31820 [Planotetraspora phitsanulokensis]
MPPVNHRTITVWWSSLAGETQPCRIGERLSDLLDARVAEFRWGGDGLPDDVCDFALCFSPRGSGFWARLRVAVSIPIELAC